jgi:hypothetical protein
MLITTLLVTSQLLYVANRTTYGCSSIEELNSLERIRGDRKAFRAELYEQIFAGQCVEINKGKVVEGSVDSTRTTVLLVDRRIEPPGFLAPLRDFRESKSPRLRGSPSSE